MTFKEYKQMFSNAPLSSVQSREIRSQKLQGRVSPTKGKHHSKEARIKIGIATSQRMRLKYGEKQTETRLCKHCNNSFVCDKKQPRKFCSSDCYNKYLRVNPPMKNKKHKNETKETIRKTLTGHYVSTETKAKILTSLRTSNKLHKHPNSFEKLFIEYCSKAGLTNIKFVGDFSFWIYVPKNYRLALNKFALNPDFIVEPIEQTKKVIELFGYKWHDKIGEYDRMFCYDVLGYDSLILWNDKQFFNERDTIMKRVSDFINDKVSKWIHVIE